MGRSKIKSFAIIFLVIFEKVFAQGIYVNYHHPVYSFLERMEILGIIENFTNETRPLLRSKIVEHLSEIFDKRFNLSQSEREFLNYFIDEFYFDMTGKLDRYEILYNLDEYNFNSQREKFIYAYTDKNEFSIFVKSHLNISSIHSKNHKPSQFLEIGGRFYGIFKNILGFEVDGRNGYLFGTKSSALQIREFSYNYKLNEKPESRFFDRAYGYVSLEFPHISFSFGKNRETIGYGRNKLILSDFSPEFEKINFRLNYKSFAIDFTHGWLQSFKPFDKNTGINRYFVHHRISFSPTQRLKLGFGESVIYMRTAPEFSYLNPFNFYKSVEHQLQDQDNATLYFDLEFLPIRKTRFYSTLLIDDIDFSKIGKHWHGNKTALSIGGNFYYQLFDRPMDFQIEYSRIEPYTFSHRTDSISYVNFGLPLTTNQPPNSFRIDFAINFCPNPYFYVNSGYSFTKWGRNYEMNGQLVNVGGDILLGKKDRDADSVYFLDGKIETIHSFNLKISYEIIRNIKFNSNLEYSKFSSGSSSFILSIGLISFL